MKGLALLVLVGCGMDEKRFERVGFARWCAQSANCDAAVEVDACVATLQGQDRQECVFDPVAATSCYEQLQSVTCLQTGSGGPVVDVPVECDSTWICGGSP